jgi:type II secretory pathway component PulF
MLARMEGRLGASHAGQLRREAAEANAQRLIDRELKRRGWTEGELKDRAKTDPVKVALAARIRRETTVLIRWLATRLHMGTRQTLNAALYLWRKEHEQANSTV